MTTTLETTAAHSPQAIDPATPAGRARRSSDSCDASPRG